MDPAKAVAAKILASFLGWLEKQSNQASPPTVLYHFTDVAGLAGILGGKTIRASLVFSLNDASEVLYGLRLARKVVERRQRNKNSAFLERAIQYLGNDSLFVANAEMPLTGELHPFAFSLCDGIDNASHWFHYAHAGRGAAIGFNSKLLVPPGLMLTPVEYQPEEQEAMIEAFLALVEAELVRAPDALLPKDTAGKLGGMLFSCYMRMLASVFKAPSFSSEREWRLLNLQVRKSSESHLETKFKTVDGRIVPFMEMNLTPGLVTKIVLGYSSPMQVNDHGLAMLIATAKMQVEVSKSKVPAR
jgi:hypothetical protein